MTLQFFVTSSSIGVWSCIVFVYLSLDFCVDVEWKNTLCPRESNPNVTKEAFEIYASNKRKASLGQQKGLQMVASRKKVVVKTFVDGLARYFGIIKMGIQQDWL